MFYLSHTFKESQTFNILHYTTKGINNHRRKSLNARNVCGRRICVEKLTSDLVYKHGIRGVCPVGEVCSLSSYF